ncbi:hypothetical protein SRB5_32690 [Streptomyces sp. RB5]|uniref:Uncharacterized protein n=1 Tax=Streptomyces smaragdinus TaxID=2585196 RepID=A0A7K0CI20_9ACTN|nr:hypothetical protein [Streptomyces smaragdinus]MQY13128.1 hypothetical protein [Streptomyces smaragdinus]
MEHTHEPGTDAEETPAPDATPTTDAGAEQPPTAPPSPEPPPAPETPAPAPGRRRGKTTGLIALALALGAVAGACAGFVVQSRRDPTPLPPLSQGTLGVDEAAVVTGPDAPRVKTDGDLRKLLLKKPSGATTAPGFSAGGDWIPLYAFADGFVEPDRIFKDSLLNDYRRGAATGWERGNEVTEVRLIQFHDTSVLGARDYAQGQLGYLPSDEFAGNRGKLVPGSESGRAFVYSKPEQKAGYLPLYNARAIAVRGDVVLDITVYGTRQISMKYLMGLAEKQLERL